MEPENLTQPSKQEKTRWWLLVLVVALALIGVGVFIWLQTRTQPDQAAVNSEVVGTINPITPVGTMAKGTGAGDPNAKVRIDAYEDFQCSACYQFATQVEPLVMKNLVDTGKVYYQVHSFLIIDRATWDSPNKESHQAANAAMCAADQGRYWDYHNLLFANWTGENVGDFTDARLLAYARLLKLDMTQFTTCFTHNTFRAEIDADMAQGLKLGVNGTPSIFVNGKQVSPGYIPTYEDILTAVNQANP